MRIKSLEIQGFKSFVDPLKLDFQEAITAVVGPNGCGKSNISDAIRWVMGEQSYKQLRGRKMEDVIFNGTAKRKAIGLASVTLNLTDSGNNGDGAGFSEISISRRLYRSGESRYLINKVPCRLKDIIDVFITKGSSNAMTVFEQSQISALISSKPEEKRFLLEEAADIVAIKYRKLTALKKLEHTEQNLLRLGDIVEEVKNQYNITQRQAKKLENYRKYQKEIVELELALLARQVINLTRDFQSIRGLYVDTERAIISFNQKVEALEKELLARQAEKEAKEETLADLKQQALSIEAELNRLEERQSATENQINRTREELGQITDEIAELKPRLDSTDENNQRLEEAIGNCERQLKAKQLDLPKLEDKAKQLKTTISGTTALLGQLKGEMVDLLREIAGHKNSIISLKTKIEETDQRRGRLEEQLCLENNSLAEMGKQAGNLRMKLDNLKSLMDLHLENKRGLANKLESLTVEVGLQKAHIEELEKKTSEASAMFKALKQMEEGYEGYSDAVKNLLVQEESDKSWVKGLLIRTIEVEKGFEVAVEAALGQKIQGLITADLSAVLTAIEFLKNKEGGKATFIIAFEGQEAKQVSVKKADAGEYNLSERGILGKAGDFVHCKEVDKRIINRLLDHVVIVEDIQTALAIFEKMRWGGDTPVGNLTMATLQGDLVEPEGIIRGGSIDKKEGRLFKRINEISELQKRLQELADSLKKEKEKHTILLNEKNEHQQDIIGLEKEMADCEIEKTALERDLFHLEKDSSKSKEKIALFQFESSQMAEQKHQMTAALEKQQVQLEDLLRQQTVMDDRLNEAEEENSNLERQLEEAKEQLSSLKMSLTEIKARKESLLQEMLGVKRMKRELEERQEKLLEKSSRNLERLSGLEATGQEVLGNLAAYKERLTLQEENILVERQNQGSIVEALKKIQKELAAAREERAALEARMKEIIPQKTELEVKLRYIEETAHSEYQMNLEDLEKLSTQVEDLDISFAQTRLIELKDKKAKLGEVNAEAIDEFKTIAERYEFLQKQYDDLLASVQDLKVLIEKLDGAMKDRFEKTFKQINGVFLNVFQRLFGGGEACLVLSQEDNLLETGIEIMAHPPGKKMQNLLLLSAGEKSLTALALLFSVFLIKPSPFCILDEVDAPLDEANISRFCKLVEELSGNTQFVIITHNKKTMAIAKVLYGVTMEENGVSKVVSLSLKDTSRLIAKE